MGSTRGVGIPVMGAMTMHHLHHHHPYRPPHHIRHHYPILIRIRLYTLPPHHCYLRHHRTPHSHQAPKSMPAESENAARPLAARGDLRG